MSIILPSAHKEIFDRTIQKSLWLIELGHWDGIEKHQLLRWLKNFDTDEERYVASAILKRFLYRSQRALKVFSDQIFDIVIPNALERAAIYEVECLDDWTERLLRGCHTLPLRFTAVENIGDGQSSRSGPIITRFHRRRFHSRLEMPFQDLERMPDTVAALVVLDDFIGTGDQFCSYVEHNNIDRLRQRIFYCPLTAHEAGLRKISERYPNITVIPVEKLSNDHSLFSDKTMHFAFPGCSEHMEFKDVYQAMNCMDKAGLALGKGGLELTYALSTSTPNNSIAALWWRKQDEWEPLVGR